MASSSKLKSTQLIQLFMFSACLVFVMFLWQGHYGLSLKDEGFLWYGAQRVMQGEIPILDFMSYDPGRYYWSASIMSLLGDNGIVSLRVAIAAFQVIGLFIGICLLVRESDWTDIIFLALAIITLVLWMNPRHKLFDITISILLIGALTYLIEKPSTKRYFLAGMAVGFAAFFGRNHGVYGVIGSLGVVAWIVAKGDGVPQFLKGVTYWAFGITVAYLPIIVMSITQPGFLNAFLVSVNSNVQSDMYLTHQVPWPWLAPFSQEPAYVAIPLFVTGVFFIMVIVTPLFILFMNIRKSMHKRWASPVVIASAILAIPYLHHAYSYATAGHLAQAIFPFLIACLAILAKQANKIKIPLMIMLCGASVCAMYPVIPKIKCDDCVNVLVSGDVIKVDPSTANNIATLRMLADKYAQEGQSILVTPFWPGAYALLGRKSPVWEVYALFPRDANFQRSEIRRIKEADPAFVLINGRGINGRKDMSYRKSHSMIYKYIVENYDYSSELDIEVYKSYGLYIRKKPLK